MKRWGLTLPAVAFFAAACGLGPEVGSTKDVTVRRYESVSGDDDIDPSSLGFTYFAETKGNARHGALGMNCLVNIGLSGDVRLVGTIIHELENTLVLADGDGYSPDWPDGLDGSWFLWDGDTRDQGYPVPADEAMWLASHSARRVHVQGRDPWLLEPVRAACEKLNSAAGVEVFRSP